MKIDRKKFAQIFNDSGLNELFFEFFDGSYQLLNLKNFFIVYDSDEEQVYITRKAGAQIGEEYFEKPATFSWYKLRHVGRSLSYSGISTVKEMKLTLELLADNLEQYKGEHNG